MSRKGRVAAVLPPTASPGPAPGGSGWRPFHSFLGPARRRTDHPLVVGTILLCLGLSTCLLLVQVLGTIWAGTQIKLMIEGQAEREAASKAMRTSLIRFSDAFARVQARTCLNTATTEKDRAECAALIPSVSDQDRPADPDAPAPKGKRRGAP